MEKINIPHSFPDKGKYLKGLLLLTKRDMHITHDESEIIKQAGNKLGFDPEFYEEALNNLLQNENIHEEPIIFSNREIAKEFLRDGLKITYSIMNPHGEFNLLKKIAVDNGIEPEYIQQLFLEMKS